MPNYMRIPCLVLRDSRILPRPPPQTEACLCIPLDGRLPKVRLRSRQLHRLLGQVRGRR
jgi:hypothetical protein